MSNQKNWERAIALCQRMLDEKVEIYEVMRIFSPMGANARRKLIYCHMDITSEDLDQIESAIEKYKIATDELAKTMVKTRIKKSMFYIKIKELYDKNKNGK